jgi:redox-sensitive bicupin YhaK (pirin superfamily)
MRLVASHDGEDGSLTIHADARVYAGKLAAGQTAEVPLAAGRHAWVQVARGRARVNGQELAAGDGASLTGERAVRVEAVDASELLAFDLA